MGVPANALRLVLMVFAVASLTALGACAAPAPLPTATPPPTQTLAPTYTPYPTQPPLPTGTPLPTHTPLPTVTPLPSPTATSTPEPTRPPAPTATPVVRSLTVEWTNIHYNCQLQCFQKIIPPVTPKVLSYAYRTFEFNLHVHNLTKDRTLTPLWYPTIIVSDGAADYSDVAPWRLGVPIGGPYQAKMASQPAVPPSGEVDWSFGFLVPGRTMYAKSVSLTVWGDTYVLDLKSRPDSPGYGFQDCGLPTPRYCENGMPPWDPSF